MAQRAKRESEILSRTVDRQGDVAADETARAVMRLLRVAAELLCEEGELNHVDPSWVDAHITLARRSRPNGRRG